MPDQSPYAQVGQKLCELGYSAIPIMPREKIPGRFVTGEWVPMKNWSDYCEKKSPSRFDYDRWAKWPDANVGIALGPSSGIIAIDVDTDDPKILGVIEPIIPKSLVRKRGARGYTVFFRLAHGQKIVTRKFSVHKKTVLEILSKGRQTVIPPSIHPETCKPYFWVSTQGLEDTRPYELGEVPDNLADSLEAALVKFEAENPTSETEPKKTKKPVNGSLRTHNSQATAEIQHPDGTVGEHAISYLESALEEECEAVATAGNGCQENTLNEAALKLGGLVAGLGLKGWDERIKSALINAGQSMVNHRPKWPWDPVEIEKKVHRGYAHGLERPREVDIDAYISEIGEDSASNLSESRVRLEESTLDLKEMLLSNIPDEIDEPVQSDDENDKYDIPQELCEVPGLVGDIVDWIVDTAYQPLTGIALFGALSYCATFFCRRYTTPRSLRTDYSRGRPALSPNLYCFTLAGSAAGKNHILQCLGALDTRTNQGLRQSDFSSTAGMLRKFVTRPSYLWTIDEVGFVLKGMKRTNVPGHMADMPKQLLELYSLSTGTFNKGYAKSEDNIPTIHWPCLSIYGTSTFDRFYEALSTENVIDGLVGRMLIAPQSTQFDLDSDIATLAANEFAASEEDEDISIGLTVPEEIINQFEAIVRIDPGVGNLNRPVNVSQKAPPCRPVRWADADAVLRLVQFERERDEAVSRDVSSAAATVIRRGPELALKLASIRAIGICPAAPRISQADINWGIALVKHCHSFVLNRLMSEMATAEVSYGKAEQKTLALIRKAENKGITRTILRRKLKDNFGIRQRAREFDEMIKGLSDDGEIASDKRATKSRGPAATVYRAQGYLSEGALGGIAH